MLDRYLKIERPHLDGLQRLYELPNGWGLSAVNAPMIHAHPFAWEVAVMKDGEINYDTELTGNVEVFGTEIEAERFIQRALNVLEGFK